MKMSRREDNLILSDWEQKTWLTYGDSITEIGNNDDPKSWQILVSNYYGFERHYGRGIGGQPFVWNEGVWWANGDGSYNSRPWFSSQPEGTTEHLGCFCSWDRITTMIPKNIKETIDLIFVMGGTNDFRNSSMGDTNFVDKNDTDLMWSKSSYNMVGGDYDITTFKGAVASTIMKLQVWCPNTVIVFGTPLSGRGIEIDGKFPNLTYQIKNDLGYTTEDYVCSIIKVAHEFSIPVIDVFGTTGVNQLNRKNSIKDTVHPYDIDGSNSGNKELARAVIGGLKSIIPKFI